MNTGWEWSNARDDDQCVSMNLDPGEAEPWNQEAWLSLLAATNNTTTI